MQGSGITLNSFGIAQKMGESAVLGLSIMSMAFGEVDITTVDLPEPSLGTYSPQYINIGISYAKTFSNSIYGGLTLRIIDESISNVSAGGIAIDAGIQYVTGNNEEKNNIRFGIALKNVGTPLQFGGDGLSTRVDAPNTNNVYQLTVEQRTEGFEMPSLINIGLAYDFIMAKEHVLTLAGNFTSNSFTNDQFTGGLQYSFKKLFSLRGGFTYEDNLFDDDLRTTVYSGPSAGLTVDVPMGSSGKKFGIDYSYRATQPWDGIHSFGFRFIL
ncbi:MAG: PorV/PorQ family protein [Bacteroidetes bacterium]|nr:PorV/PorQ family protein [Bacteroidota bacterium]